MITPSEFEYRSVPLPDIDTEQPAFRITTNSDVDDLVSAFARVGLLNPPVLLPHGEGFRVVSGFRRIAAAHASSWREIPARILPFNAEPLICAKLSISENAIERSLNLIELSRAISLLTKLSSDQSERNRIAEELGIPASSSYTNKIEPLCDLPEIIQKGILSDDIALPVALMLAKLPAETAAPLSEFLIFLKLGLNRQREVTELVTEIAAREDCSVAEVIQSGDILSILEQPEMDLPRKAGLIRHYLKRRRFPELTRAEDAFQQLRNDLNLGTHATLKPPPGFENKRYSITFSFESQSDLENHQKTLARLSSDARLKSLLDS